MAIQGEGKIRYVGISTPEHDQNSVIDLMRGGWVDAVQVITIYSTRNRRPNCSQSRERTVSPSLSAWSSTRVSSPDGTKDTTFTEDDFRSRYFEGDRLERAVARVEKVRHEIDGSGLTLPQAAIQFALAHPAVSTVIPGIRSVVQAEANAAASDLAPMPAELLERLRQHAWLRAFWYEGK